MATENPWKKSKTDLTQIYAGGFNAHQKQVKEDPEFAFHSFLVDNGFILDRLIPDGRIHRIGHVDHKKAKKDGWYILFMDGVPCGIYGDWTDGGDAKKWCAKRDDELTEKELAENRRRMEEAKRIRQEELEAQYKESALIATQKIASLPIADKNHPYLVKKKIKPLGIRQDGDRLLIPVYSIDGGIQSYQTIDNNGDKLFQKGGKLKGGFYQIGELTTTIGFCEGFATGATIYELTGYCVFVAFNCGNLEEVVKAVLHTHQGKIYKIFADNDQFTKNNPGLEKAQLIEKKYSIEAYYPNFKDTSSAPTDFNDLYSLEGAEVTRHQLGMTEKALYKPKDADEALKQLPIHLLRVPGALGAVVDYFNSTAVRPQPGFAVQTALALGSVLVGRRFKTEKNNFSSLYFLNIAKSGTGKEHSKSVIENVLSFVGKDGLIGGNGFTSTGAVMSELLARPVCITVIDEMGKYLEATKEKGGAGAQQKDVKTTLMEAIGRLHGTLRPKTYSTMSVKSDVNGRKIIHPALTLLGMTTPSTFFDNVDKSQIEDGFLGRFICLQSFTPRSSGGFPEFIEPDHSIKSWVESLDSRFHGNLSSCQIADVAPSICILEYDQEALQIFREFDEEIIREMDKHESAGLDRLLGRTSEFAMRISLILALSEDPTASKIGKNQAKWATDYMRFTSMQTIENVSKNVFSSDFERQKVEALFAIRSLGSDGITEREAGKKKPFCKHLTNYREMIFAELVKTGLIEKRDVREGKPGRARIAYVAINGGDDE